MGPTRTTKVSKAEAEQQRRERLEPLIEAAIVDAYNEDEQEGGFLVMLEEHLAIPFAANVIGEPVEILGFDLANRGQGIVAKVRRKGRKFQVNVFELEFDSPPPKGAEWIDAYRLWAGE